MEVHARCIALAAPLFVGAIACGATSAAAAPTLTIAYSGSGSYRTVYHGEPPNPGGMHDTNDARDSSTQRWSLHFNQTVRLADCGGGCTRTVGGAAGATAVTGHVDHVHRDGLYRQLDASARCTIRYAPPRDVALSSTITVRVAPGTHVLRLVAEDPVQDAIELMPQACPPQGDSIDGLADSYFVPGFSFAAGYGPVRWFTSAPVAVSVARLERARTLRIRIAGPTRAGAPPRRCAVRHPAYERCSTGGAWSGVLTLRVRR